MSAQQAKVEGWKQGRRTLIVPPERVGEESRAVMLSLAEAASLIADTQRKLPPGNA